MTVRVRCPNPDCGKTSMAPEEAVGREARCKHCGRPFVLSPAG